jgi:hypothetical protein
VTPQTQLFCHDPGNGITGDCLRACWASILDLAIDEVPHFGEGYPDKVIFWRRVDDFLAARGLVRINVAFDASAGLDRILESVELLNPGLFFLLGGVTVSGVGHSVVAGDGKIIHDPNPDKVGIAGPCSNGCYELTFVGSAVAAGSIGRTGAGA